MERTSCEHLHPSTSCMSTPAHTFVKDLKSRRKGDKAVRGAGEQICGPRGRRLGLAWLPLGRRPETPERERRLGRNDGFYSK